MIGSSDNRVSYDGNGIATEFAYTFKILEKSDMNVLHVAADGTETLLTKDYYVDMEKSVVLYPGYAPGAEIPESERPPVLPVGERLVLYREVPITQESALDKHWPFNVVENGLDKLTIICQQMWDRLQRSFYVSEATSTNFDTKIPIEAGKTFRVKDDGTGFEVTEDPGKVIDGAKALLKQTTEQADFAKEQADASSQSAVNAQNAADAAEAVAPEYAKTKEVLDNIVSYTNTATEQASIATAKANAANISATNAAQSYANADAIAGQLTEYLNTKEELTAPAVDKTLLIEGAAADSKVVGELKSDLVELDAGYRFYENSLFKNGAINYSTGEIAINQKRIVTKSILMAEDDIVINNIGDGFQAVIYYYNDSEGTVSTVRYVFLRNNGNTSGVIYNVLENPYTIAKDSFYRIVIQRITEIDETADISVFARQIYIQSAISKKFEGTLDKDSIIKFANRTVSGSFGLIVSDSVIPINVSLSEKNVSFKSGYIHIGNNKTVTVSASDVTLAYINGFIVYSFDKNGYICKPNAVTQYVGENEVLILVYSQYGKYIGCPSLYAIDGCKYGIANRVLSPDYEIAVCQNFVHWSDFFIKDGKLWVFTESSDETHTANNGTIRFYDISNYPNIVYEKKIYHNIGHCNTVSYNAKNDCLLIGNLPGSEEYRGALYIIHHVSDWYNMDDGAYIDFNDLNPIIIDLQDLKTPFGMAASSVVTNVTACWGESNGSIENIVYVSTTMNMYWAKILLGTGTNQFGYGTYTERQDGEYNGTFNVLKSSKFDNVFSPSKEVTQGIDYIDGRIITANGHDGMFGSVWTWNSIGGIERDIIENVEYADDGSILTGMHEGLAYDNGYLYQGVFLGANEIVKRLVRYKII